jgi:hypothetical protein
MLDTPHIAESATERPGTNLRERHVVSAGKPNGSTGAVVTAGPD